MGVTMARYQVKEISSAEGYTLKRLSDTTGLSLSRLRAIANNRVDDVTVGTLERIAAVLNRPLQDVFEPSTLAEVPTVVDKKKKEDGIISPNVLVDRGGA